MHDQRERSPILEAIPMAIFDAMYRGFGVVRVIYDENQNAVDYQFLETNKAFEYQTKLKGIVGKRMSNLTSTQADLWLKHFAEVAKTGISRQFEAQTPLADGFNELDVFKLPLDEDDLVGFLINNVTAYREEAQSDTLDNLKNRFLMQLNDELKGLNPEDVQFKAAELLGTTLAADRVLYKTVTMQNHERAFDVNHFYHAERAPFNAGLYPFHLFGQLIKDQDQGKIVVVNNLERSNLRPAEKSVFESINVKSFIQVPLVKDGKLVAALAVHQTVPRNWKKHEIELVQETAERTWGAVQHAITEFNLKSFNNKLEEIVKQRTEEIEQANTNLQDHKDLLQSIFNAIPHAMAVYRPLHNDSAEIVDFELFLYNPLVGEIFNMLATPTPKTYTNLFPMSIKYGLIERFKQVMQSGMPQDFEIYFDDVNEWFRFKVGTVNQLLIVMRENISERKLMEISILENQSLIQSVFNTSLIGMSLLGAERNDKGEVVDFKIKLTNQALNKETGRSDLIGKYYAAEYPGIKEVGLFEIMLEVMESGKPAGKEYFYQYEGFNKWYSCMFVKTDDSLVATNLDITERKLAEALIMQNAAMINAIAESAPHMLYAIDLDQQTQFYSNAKIEELLQLSQAEIKALGQTFFEHHIHSEDLSNFKESLKELRNSEDNTPRSLTYRLIDAKGQVHWIRTTRAVYQRNADGTATHVVGVSQDVSQEIALAERNKELELQADALQREQQHAVLEASLMAQEEERRRISDNLHNGLGQVLYGIKARMDQLELIVENDVIKLGQIKELLASSIAESRRLSHELMPPMLEDYSLSDVLANSCKDLSGQTRFIFSHHHIDDKMDTYMKMMVYRIVQELMININNHAHASIAQVSVRKERKILSIRVEDNGVGFDSANVHNWGFGLNSIANKIEMLAGSMEVESKTEIPTGTKIKIKIPLN